MWTDCKGADCKKSHSVNRATNKALMGCVGIVLSAHCGASEHGGIERLERVVGIEHHNIGDAFVGGCVEGDVVGLFFL